MNIQTKALTLVALLLFSLLGGNIVQAGAVSSNTPEIVLLTPSSTQSITLAWLPVSMNASPDQIAYAIHVSKTNKFIPNASTLHHTVIGKTQTMLKNLTAGTTYYVLIIADDQQGKTITGSKYVSATTFTVPLVFNSSTPLTTSDALKLGNCNLKGDTLTFTKTALTKLPAINSVLACHNSNGSYLLRHVDNVSVSGSQINLTTSQASLSDALNQGTVSSKMKLFDVSSTSASSPMMQAKRMAQTNGNRYSKMSWDNELITAEQTEYAYRGKQLSITPKNVAGQYAMALKKSVATVSEEVSLNAAVNFTPTLDTELSWSNFGAIESGRLIATGTLSLDASAVYDFQAAGSYNPAATTLFTRPFTSVYFVGGVPVYQQVTLTVKAQISAQANSKIKASTHANIAETVSIGVTYNPATQQWQPVFNQAEKKSFTAHLNINGGVQAEIRLIPEITVKFYRVAAGTLSLEPYFNGNLQAKEISSNPTVLAALAPRVWQPTQFDVNLGWDSYASANLQVLWHNVALYPRTKIAGTTTPLFTLPTLQLSASSNFVKVGDATDITLQVSNGVNDKFNPASIRWNAIPSDASGLASITNQGCTPNQSGFECHASLTANTTGSYSVLASGFGGLGDVGRQYAIRANPIVANSGCPIGGTGPAGGIMFYFTDATCAHGLEAAPVDQTSSVWGCYGYSNMTGSGFTWTTVGNTGIEVGTGAANTAAIIAACPSGSAAAVAAAYSLNGYADWYLPSAMELFWMSLYIGPGAIAPLTNAGGFTFDSYWSSTEMGSYEAWYQSISKFNINGFNAKFTTKNVRAVRSF